MVEPYKQWQTQDLKFGGRLASAGAPLFRIELDSSFDP